MGTTLLSILEEQVVSKPLVQILSLIAPGTPAKVAIASPAAIFASTLAACAKAFSLSKVT